MLTLVEVGTLEHQMGALASKLEGNLLQIAVSRGLHDLPAGDGASGECDLVDIFMRRESGTTDATQRGDSVENTWREAALNVRADNRTRECGPEVSGRTLTQLPR